MTDQWVVGDLGAHREEKEKWTGLSLVFFSFF